jgi:integrase
MAVRKIRRTWWVDFQVKRKRYRYRSPVNSREGALEYEALLRQKLTRGVAVERRAIEKDVIFEEFAWTWFKDYVVPTNKPSEQQAKRCILTASLIPFFGSIPVREIKPLDVDLYKAKQARRGISNKTIRNHLTILNKCLVTAYEWLQFDGAPPKIKWPRCTVPDIDYLSPDECELLVSHADGIIREMVLFALRTGMRQGEIRGLQWSSVDWLNRSVTVRHSLDNHCRQLLSPKSGRIRHIPLDTGVYEMLYRRKRETGHVFLASNDVPFSNYRVNYAMKGLCKRAGLRQIGWHTLRHTFATHLAMRGVPLNAVKELMGHSSITTTMRYAHVAPSALRSAINLLSGDGLADAECQPGVNTWLPRQGSEFNRKSAAPKYA